tara:strand:+ start:131 stop:322 length:192 start_codon:yes stop_codon:yes gene_type:complete
MKVFKRSVKRRKLFGVCGGLAAYTGTDPLLWRFAAVVMFLWPYVPALLLYLFLTFLTEEDADI